MRLTKIVCTLGPASIAEDILLSLAQEGMDIARINFAHGTSESHRDLIRQVRALNDAHDRSIAVMIDIKGPEIRTGDVQQPIVITKGTEVLFSSKETDGGGLPVIRVNYDKFAQDVAGAERIILDNGTINFELVTIRSDGAVVARALDDGQIGSRRHINLPGAHVSLPALTDKDWTNLALGVEEKVDFVAISFVRTAHEVEEVRKYLQTKNSLMRIIAKIETREAVQNIDEIIAASDGIMVARGDLGVELPFESIPAIQDMIVTKCRHAETPVIIATHMLESMTEHPMPTRAEVTDIAHAATLLADATMLSGETAAGKYPVESFRAMARILEETESRSSFPSLPETCPYGERHALAEAAVSMAIALRVPAILVLTASGQSALALSAFRPGIPIIALTESEAMQRLLKLPHGVFPFAIDFDADPEVTVGRALETVRARGLADHGARVVVMTDAKTKIGSVRTVQVRPV